MSILRNIFDSIRKLIQTEDKLIASQKSELSREEVLWIYAHTINYHAAAMRVPAGGSEDLGIIDGLLYMEYLANLATDAGINRTEIYEAIWKIRERY